MTPTTTIVTVTDTKGGGGGVAGQFGDTTYRKVFVGGLAWETQKEKMRKYFEQFGEILEAVVITDKNTGRSKGYGFVTFREPEAAMRACVDAAPVIDGRRANCNLASLGIQRTRPPTPQHAGGNRFRMLNSGATSFHTAAAAAAFPSSATFPHHYYGFPYNVYGYSTAAFAPAAADYTAYPAGGGYYGMYGGGGGQYYPVCGGAAAAGMVAGASFFPINYFHHQQMQMQMIGQLAAAGGGGGAYAQPLLHHYSAAGGGAATGAGLHAFMSTDHQYYGGATSLSLAAAAHPTAYIGIQQA